MYYVQHILNDSKHDQHTLNQPRYSGLTLHTKSL